MKRVLALIGAMGLGVTGASADQSFDWSGPFIGFHGGGGWGWAEWDAPSGVAIWAPSSGFPAAGLTIGSSGGIHAGYSRDFGQVILGVEAAFNVTNMLGQVECGDGAVYGYVCDTRLRSIGTLTGRIGYGFQNAQIYAFGGVAVGRHDLAINEPYFAYVFSTPQAHTWGAGDLYSIGYTAGVGAEAYISHGVSVRADFAYVRFPEQDAQLTSPVWPATDILFAGGYHLASLGLNYRFGADDAERMTAANSERWDIDVGKRAFLSAPYFRFDLYDPFSPTSQISRLIYSGTIGLSTEGFVTAQAPNGFFLAGELGVGAGFGGTLVDEDFPPYVVPYTATVSDLHDVRLGYGALDLGWEIVDRERVSIAAFAGLSGRLERYPSYGCVQTAPGSPICVPSVPSDYEVITQTMATLGLRFGVSTEVAVTERIGWRGEAVVRPLAFMAGVDNHWLRPDINPLPQYGVGRGFELESAVSIAVTEQLELAAGGRIGWTQTNGESLFPGGLAQPSTFTSRNLGIFLEARYALPR